MVKLCDTARCTGCGACANICSQSCIVLKAGKGGALFPSIEENYCIGCRKCEKVCAELHPVKLHRPRKVLAACASLEEERTKGASGGIAGVFYRHVLKTGGSVYGVTFNGEHEAVFERKVAGDDIEGFRGSKYTGSLMGDIYLKIKKDLKNGENVLFIGVGCQIAGLLNYLGENYHNLITVDLLCHGMPSHLYFKEYIEQLEKVRSSSVQEISFRDNNIFRLKCRFTDSVYECRAKYDSYFAGYTSMLFYRDCCYTCRYARVERCSDITLGDFWGYGNEKRLEPAAQGVSMILLNTEKGEKFFKTVEKSVRTVSSTLERAVSVNSQLREPSSLHPLRKEFIEAYDSFGFMEASRKVIRKIIRKNRRDDVIGCIKKGTDFPYRILRKMKRKMARLLAKKNIGKAFRNKWRNRYERQRLKNTDFTIFSNTCIGGIISHDMGLQFLSPTVNLYMQPKDFVKFMEDLEHYLSAELTEIEHPAHYPVGKLEDLTLYLKHYNSFEEAKTKWDARKKRINYENLYVMMTDRDFTPPDKERRACSREVLERFSKLPYKKICFTGKSYPDLECCRQVKKNRDGDCVNIITDIVSYSGKRLYQYAERFDYIDWLNSREEEEHWK